MKSTEMTQSRFWSQFFVTLGVWTFINYQIGNHIEWGFGSDFHLGWAAWFFIVFVVWFGGILVLSVLLLRHPIVSVFFFGTTFRLIGLVFDYFEIGSVPRSVVLAKRKENTLI